MWDPVPSSSCGGESETPEGSEGCSLSRFESRKCRIEEGPEGKPVQKCEVIRRLLKQCPGKPVEEIESTREETTSSLGPDSKALGDFQDQANVFGMGALHSLMEDFAGIFNSEYQASFPDDDTEDLKRSFDTFPFPPPSWFFDGAREGERASEDWARRRRPKHSAKPFPHGMEGEFREA